LAGPGSLEWSPEPQRPVIGGTLAFDGAAFGGEAFDNAHHGSMQVEQHLGLVHLVFEGED
jgi:hypothetical protein